jgi:low temperature requirement protein LtrA
MGVSTNHVFDTDPATNTGLTFLTGYLCSRLMYLIAYCIDMYYIPELRFSIRNHIISNFVAIIVFLPLYFFPSNGERRVEDIKYVLWAVASFITTFSIIIEILLISRLKNCLALNIEHFTERMGLFVVLGNYHLTFKSWARLCLDLCLITLLGSLAMKLD